MIEADPRRAAGRGECRQRRCRGGSVRGGVRTKPMRWSWRRSTQPERVTFVGTAETERAFRRKLELFPDLHMSVIAAHDSSEIGVVDQRLLEATERLVFAPASLDDQGWAASSPSAVRQGRP